MLASSETGAAGVVFTKPWAVDLILDLAGYSSEKRLFEQVAFEPSAGDGAFIRAMVRRLVESCRQHKVPLSQAEEALRAFEIDPVTASNAAKVVEAELISLGESGTTAACLARSWVRCEDFLDASLGFPVADYVVGNPPYVRLEEIPPAKADLYRNAFRTMRGRSDLYVAFYEAALMQLKPGGMCAYICADRWLLNDYGSALRNLITDGFNVRFIVEAHDVDAFEAEVSAYPAITIISTGKQGQATVAKLFPGAESADRRQLVDQLRVAKSDTFLRSARLNEWFRGAEPWPCSSPERLAVLRQMEASCIPLENEETGTRVGIGVATGADKIFIVKGAPDVERDRLLPLAMGEDLAGPQVNWSGSYLINPWHEDGLVELNRFPKTHAYLLPHLELLSGRHTAKDHPMKWHKTIDRVNLSLVREHKLYIADIRGRLEPALDNGETYPHHNIYWITSRKWDLRVLGGLLMSDVGEFFVRCYGVRMRGGYFRFQAQYLRRIRVPHPEQIPASIKKQLATAFTDFDRAKATALAHMVYGIKALPE